MPEMAEGLLRESVGCIREKSDIDSQPYRGIHADELRDLLASSSIQQVLVIDVRKKYAFDQDHIPGAKHIEIESTGAAPDGHELMAVVSQALRSQSPSTGSPMEIEKPCPDVHAHHSENSDNIPLVIVCDSDGESGSKHVATKLAEVLPSTQCTIKVLLGGMASFHQCPIPTRRAAPWSSMMPGSPLSCNIWKIQDMSPESRHSHSSIGTPPLLRSSPIDPWPAMPLKSSMSVETFMSVVDATTSSRCGSEERTCDGDLVEHLMLGCLSDRISSAADRLSTARITRAVSDPTPSRVGGVDLGGWSPGGGVCLSSGGMRNKWKVNITTPTEVMPAEVIDGKLFLGNRLHASSQATLTRLGVTHVVNVSRDSSAPFESRIKYLCCRAPDDETSDLSWVFDQAFDFIEDARNSSPCNCILVHCSGGISRSSAVVVSYLMRKLSLTLSDSLSRVRVKHPAAAPNAGFLNQLLDLERRLGIGRGESSCLNACDVGAVGYSPLAKQDPSNATRKRAWAGDINCSRTAPATRCTA